MKTVCDGELWWSSSFKAGKQFLAIFGKAVDIIGIVFVMVGNILILYVKDEKSFRRPYMCARYLETFFLCFYWWLQRIHAHSLVTTFLLFHWFNVKKPENLPL